MGNQLLIAECKKGESKAQKQLYEKYAPAMMSICLRYVRHKETARDLMHDGFITLFTKIHTYSGTGLFSAWVKKIFVNTALEYLRSNDVLKFSTNIEDVHDIQQPDISALDQLSADELLECITKLPDGYRTIFNMYAIEGYSHTEISQILKIQEGTSRSQYARARQLLQKMVIKKSTILNER